jgi:uncharacterized protein (DUF58 family)
MPPTATSDSPPARRARLTPLGRAVAGIGALVAAAGWVATENVALLAGVVALVAPAIAWLAARRALGGIGVEISAPAEVFARERFELRVRLSKAANARPDFGIEVDVPGPRGASGGFASALGAGESTELAFRATFGRRGLATIPGAALRTSFPLGLAEAAIDAPAEARVLVLPEPARLSPSRIRALAAIVPEPATAEVQRHRTRDPEDLYMLVPWQPRMPARRIHARSSARHGRPIARELRGSPEGAVVVVLDVEPPVAPARRSPIGFERGVATCAALVLRFERAGVRHRFRAGASAAASARAALRVLATVAPGAAAPDLSLEHGTLVWVSPAGRPAPARGRFDAVIDFFGAGRER